MNFFEHQHQARRNTKFLVFLFILALIAILIAINSVATFAFLYFSGKYSRYDEAFTFGVVFWQVARYATPLALLIVGGVIHFRIQSLGGHGRAVALFLGAELLPQNTTAPEEVRLRNVVEEMAIASSMPVPEIYIMREQNGINAFAAGTTPTNAVIGVTQGAIESLSRDELQGVVAHEFSHIFNGDMRLNINLIGILSGILFLATTGRVLVRSVTSGRRRRSSKSDGSGPIVLIGLALLIIGWIGVFFGRWIKAAVSRQREFLADASAVQYTRNPGGLAGALAKIKVHSAAVNEPHADEASHMFFGSIKNFFLFATHPPIEERLTRMNQLGALLAAEERRSAPAAASTQLESTSHGPLAGMTPHAKAASLHAVLQHIGQPTNGGLIKAESYIQRLPDELKQEIRNPDGAQQVILATLVADSGDQPSPRDELQFKPHLFQYVRKFSGEDPLALVNLALPALKGLDAIQINTFLNRVETLVKRDKVIRAFEVAVTVILRRYLALTKNKATRLVHLKDLSGEVDHVLTTLARAGAADIETAYAAYEAGLAQMRANGPDFETWQKYDLEPSQLVDDLLLLGSLSPRDKQVFFSALWATAHHDHELTASESHYLRAVSEALEIPLPLA